MLTQKDFDEIEALLDTKLDEKLEEKLKHFPNKEEFYAKMDELMGEVKAMREEQEIHSGQHSDINDELESHALNIKKIVKHIGVSL